jgi:hypothetical protein
MNILKEVFTDLMLISGFLGLFYGIYCLNKPASFIVCGVILMYFFAPKNKKSVILPEYVQKQQPTVSRPQSMRKN